LIVGFVTVPCTAGASTSWFTLPLPGPAVAQPLNAKVTGCTPTARFEMGPRVYVLPEPLDGVPAGGAALSISQLKVPHVGTGEPGAPTVPVKVTASPDVDGFLLETTEIGGGGGGPTGGPPVCVTEMSSSSSHDGGLRPANTIVGAPAPAVKV
jgi:hypothetical protein